MFRFAYTTVYDVLKKSYSKVIVVAFFVFDCGRFLRMVYDGQKITQYLSG